LTVVAEHTGGGTKLPEADHVWQLAVGGTSGVPDHQISRFSVPNEPVSVKSI
jgi:hypothetical protein